LRPFLLMWPSGMQHLGRLTILLLAGALVLAVATASVATVIALRTRQRFEERLAAAARRIAGEWSARSELAASLDAEAVIHHTLSATAALPGVDGALLLVDENGERRTVALGLSQEEADRAALQTPANTNLRAMEVAYRYRLDEVGDASKLPRVGLVVPLRGEDKPIGSLAAISRSATPHFNDDTVAALEGIARRAGPALLTARLFAEARQLADLDSLTGLYNRRCFHDFLEREVARARRYERRLSVIVLDLDNFKRINDRIGHLAADAVLAGVAERIRIAVRGTDIAARVGGDEFAIILPESGRGDAERLAGRIMRGVSTTPTQNAGVLQVSAGVAELGRDDSAANLFERADNALYRAKDAGKARTVAS
jgi:diguanylate cyclase (GGDEF)-like protein